MWLRSRIFCTSEWVAARDHHIEKITELKYFPTSSVNEKGSERYEIGWFFDFNQQAKLRGMNQKIRKCCFVFILTFTLSCCAEKATAFSSRSQPPVKHSFKYFDLTQLPEILTGEQHLFPFYKVWIEKEYYFTNVSVWSSLSWPILPKIYSWVNTWKGKFILMHLFGHDAGK